jgi:plastocyanin
MKNKLITVIGVSVALFLGGAVQATEQNEEVIPSSQVPAVVQKAAEKEAKGGKLVQWEKEGKNYEAIIEKNGKQWGYLFDAKGHLKNKHDESKETESSEKAEKH